MQVQVFKNWKRMYRKGRINSQIAFKYLQETNEYFFTLDPRGKRRKRNRGSWVISIFFMIGNQQTLPKGRRTKDIV